MRRSLSSLIPILTFLSVHGLFSQDFSVKGPAGERNVAVSRPSGASALLDENLQGLMLLRTEKELSIIDDANAPDPTPLGTVVAPVETKLAGAEFKTNDPLIILTVDSKGTFAFPTLVPQVGEMNPGSPVKPPTDLSNAQKIVGDALYVLKSGKVYVSRDSAKTWLLDTAAIAAETVSDVAVDSSGYGWIVTQSRNLYYQHPDSNVWHKQPAYVTTGFPSSVFVDRKGRMFISSSASATRVSYSTDGGASWTAVTSGLTEAVNKFGDDAFGNIYALGTASQVFRLTNLAPPWTSIGDSLAAQAYLPPGGRVVNAISGDTVLYAATIFGMFQSTDFGSTWKSSANRIQSRSHIFYAGVYAAGNYRITSTNLGLFRAAVGSSSWEKIYPQQGFIAGINAVTSDSAGIVYGNFPLKIGPTSSIFYTMKSTDRGATWALDTAGYKSTGILSGTQQFDFWVDKQGTQYLGGNGKFLSKRIGQPWKLDTTGLGIIAGQFVKPVTQNNKKGIVYLCRTVPKVPSGIGLIVYSRTVSDSVWHVVNTAVPGDGDGTLISDHQGNILLKSLTPPYNIWRYDGVNWTQTPLPTGLGSIFSQNLVFDENGTLWGTFFAGGNKGVYFTTNNGTSWNYVGLNGYGINTLSVVDDTVYAVTAIDGIYRFTTSSTPTSVQNISETVPSNFELLQNYPNPFNPTTAISFQLSASTNVRLAVYDVLGRKVATLVDEHKPAGAYRVTFDASKFASGLYVYKLEAGTYSTSRKMLLMK